MIRISRLKTQNTRSVTINGHAGYAEKGKDIVCAGASMLLFTLIEYLDQLGVEHHSYAESGGASVVCTGELDRRARDAFDVIETGFSMLAEKYPEYVELV